MQRSYAAFGRYRVLYLTPLSSPLLLIPGITLSPTPRQIIAPAEIRRITLCPCRLIRTLSLPATLSQSTTLLPLAKTRIQSEESSAKSAAFCYSVLMTAHLGIVSEDRMGGE